MGEEAGGGGVSNDGSVCWPNGALTVVGTLDRCCDNLGMKDEFRWESVLGSLLFMKVVDIENYTLF